MVIIPFAEEHWPVAVEAYARFGKGRHAAALNFGDCLTYAVARLAEQSLLSRRRRLREDRPHDGVNCGRARWGFAAASASSTLSTRAVSS